MKELTSEELKEKIKRGENFALDLFAEWCGPCKIMLSNMEKVQNILTTRNDATNYDVYKFNIENDMDLMKEWGVRGVPTIKIFKSGEEIFSQAGVMSAEDVLNQLS